MADDLLVLRTPCGMGGDMLVAGLAALAGLDQAGLAERVDLLGLPALGGGHVRLVKRPVLGIIGHQLQVNLPHEHAHRGLAEIADIIERSRLLPGARETALRAFRRLAEAEGEMHGLPPEEVHFHEVGALDSVLDTCLAAQLHAELGSPDVVCSPLPLGDGQIRCQHGLLAAPAPAVLHMLADVPVYGVGPVGETVTPTALAMLHSLQCRFGDWPPMTVRRTARAYGTRVFDTLPNGLMLAIGSRRAQPTRAAGHDHGAVHSDSHHRHGHPHGHPHDHQHD
jgi:uncharacterized protein (DUF111 family)